MKQKQKEVEQLRKEIKERKKNLRYIRENLKNQKELQEELDTYEDIILKLKTKQKKNEK